MALCALRRVLDCGGLTPLWDCAERGVTLPHFHSPKLDVWFVRAKQMPTCVHLPRRSHAMAGLRSFVAPSRRVETKCKRKLVKADPWLKRHSSPSVNEFPVSRVSHVPSRRTKVKMDSQLKLPNSPIRNPHLNDFGLFDREIGKVFPEERLDFLDVSVEGNFNSSCSKLKRHTRAQQLSLLIRNVYVSWVTVLFDVARLVQIQIAGEVIQNAGVTFDCDFMTEGLGRHSRHSTSTTDLSKANCECIFLVTRPAVASRGGRRTSNSLRPHSIPETQNSKPSLMAKKVGLKWKSTPCSIPPFPLGLPNARMCVRGG